MDHEVGPWKMAFVNGPRSWSDFPTEKLVLRALGPSLGVNRMWTKKNDHAPKSERADFLIHVQKGQKIQVWPFCCLLLGFTCLHF